MENSTVSGLRSRSRSKTPFLRSSCDRESCHEDGHSHLKSGRRTPMKRSMRLSQTSTGRKSPEPIVEEEDHTSPPLAHRTRNSTRRERILKTSDYSSEEGAEVLNNNDGSKKYSHESHQVTTSSQHTSGNFDVNLSPIHGYNASGDGYTRVGSPTYSSCSTDSLFAEQALADASTLVEQDPEHSYDHLPYRLYKFAGEYWNKYPKTDYTYSRMSKDRVELAPGQVALPNMSRRSLSNFRVNGPNVTADEVDMLRKTYARKRYTSIESSDDEAAYYHRAPYNSERHWWITQLLISIITTITSTVSHIYDGMVGRQSYPYGGRREGVLSKTASFLSAPFYWIYTIVTKIVTTTITTVTESVSTNHVSPSRTTSLRRNSQEKKRRWWPWLLLLLLPIGYACYNYDAIKDMMPSEEIKPPRTVLDSDLDKRVIAIEEWAKQINDQFNVFSKKLAENDNLDAKLESLTIKHLQRNIIQIFNLNQENSAVMAQKLKKHFDEYYATKENLESMSSGIYDRVSANQKPEFDDERVRQIVQEYMALFELRQREVVVEKVREFLTEVRVEKGDFDVDAIRKIVAAMLEIYDADKTGLVDYAMESAGGQILSTRCTELYEIKSKQYQILGIPVKWLHTTPRYVLTPGAMPGECWAFQGFPGYLVIKLSAVIEVTGFSLEHMSRLLAADGKIESAPKNFSVYGLHDELDQDPHLFGNYIYDDKSTSVQYFPVQKQKTENIGGVEYPIAHDIVELRIESNHGNPTYTCVYRLRVHGNPKIKMATDDWAEST